MCMRNAALEWEREVCTLRAVESWLDRLTLDWAMEESFDMARLWRCFDSLRRVRIEATVAFKCSSIGPRSGGGIAGAFLGSCAGVPRDTEGSRKEDALLTLGLALLLKSTSEDVCSFPRVRPSSCASIACSWD